MDVIDILMAKMLSGGGDPETIASAVTDWLEDNVDPVGSAVVVDSSLSIEGAAADAKVTGDALSEKIDMPSGGQSGQALLSDGSNGAYWGEAQGGGGSGITDEAKAALLACFRNVAWVGSDGQSYYNDLYDALYPPAPPAALLSISASFNQGSAVIYETDSLDTLKQYLTVTARYSNGTTQTVTNYMLSGTLVVGTSTITVSYGGKTTTFNVTVTEALLPAEYQQVEWIGTNNSDSTTTIVEAHFDTDFIPTPSSSMYARFATVGTQNSQNYMGIRDSKSGSDKAFRITSFSSAGKIGFMRWGASVQCISYDNAFHDYELTPTTAKVDNVSYTMAAPVTSQASSKSIYVFGEFNGESRWVNTANIKLASLALYEGTEKVRDYIPCYRKSDGVIGMYDTVNREFKTNEGTGSFTKGGDVA